MHESRAPGYISLRPRPEDGPTVRGDAKDGRLLVPEPNSAVDGECVVWSAAGDQGRDAVEGIRHQGRLLIGSWRQQ